MRIFSSNLQIELVELEDELNILSQLLNTEVTTVPIRAISAAMITTLSPDVIFSTEAILLFFGVEQYDGEGDPRGLSLLVAEINGRETGKKWI